jgi:hypothetical protein
MSVATEMKRFLRAAEASNDFPGAVAWARGYLKRLRALYRANPKKFSSRTIDTINEHQRHLPKWVDLITCPVCQGMQTQRWMISYKHTCNRCGGWGRVEKTPEAVKENEWIWGRP